MTELKRDERIDDLQRNGYRIIQKKDGFSFGTDAVLLAWFADYKDGDWIMDLGCGNGIVPLLMDSRREERTARFTGLEIREEAADLARRSAALNGADERIKIETGDLKEASSLFGRGSFDVVTCNPPYFKKGSGIVNPESEKSIARHEVLCTLEDVLRESALLLKTGGHLFLVHRPNRLEEIFSLCERFGLGPARLLTVHPYKDREAVLILFEAVRGGHPELHLGAPVVLYSEKDVCTPETAAIYNDGRH